MRTELAEFEEKVERYESETSNLHNMEKEEADVSADVDQMKKFIANQNKSLDQRRKERHTLLAAIEEVEGTLKRLNMSLDELYNECERKGNCQN